MTMTDGSRRLQPLTVQAELEWVGKVTDYAAEAAHLAGLRERVTYYLCLAVDEIATNIIVHGYKQHECEGKLTISAEIRSQELIVFLDDTAPSYDPRQVPPPDLRQPPDRRQPGGLGIFLALRSVDRFLYERVQDHNRSTFVIHRPPTVRGT